MAYQVTPAHRTASAARHAGDPVWPGNEALIIRRANIYPSTERKGAVQPAGADLGFVEAIGPLLQAVVGLGKTAYDIRMQQLDTKRARAREADTAAVAAREAAAAEVAAGAAAKQAAAMNAELPRKTLAAGGLAVVAALGLFFALRRK